MARKKKAAGKVRVNLADVGSAFKPNEEYAVKIVDAELKEGSAAPYFKLKLAGVDEEFENSFMYHNASTSPEALWRLKPLLEAFDIDIPDGEMELTPKTFIGHTAMCDTFLDRYEGGSSVKPGEFWPLDGDKEDDDEDEKDGGDVDLSELSDADIKKLAKEFEIKVGRGKKGVDAAREELEECDEDELKEACEDLGIELGAGEEEDEEEEEKPKRGRKSSSKKSSSKKGGKKKSEKFSEDELAEMSEDELQEVVDNADLDVDLDEYKTLRKKRGAVIDALEEQDLIED